MFDIELFRNKFTFFFLTVENINKTKSQILILTFHHLNHRINKIIFNLPNFNA